MGWNVKFTTRNTIEKKIKTCETEHCLLYTADLPRKQSVTTITNFKGCLLASVFLISFKNYMNFLSHEENVPFGKLFRPAYKLCIDSNQFVYGPDFSKI